MKAANILHSAQGRIAGAISLLDDLGVRLATLQKISDDVASGVLPRPGADGYEVLAMCLSREIEATGRLVEHFRSGYALLIACASHLPRPSPDAVDFAASDSVWLEVQG